MATELLRPTGHATVYSGERPAEGPRAVSLILDFSQFATIDIDFTLAFERKEITSVQSFFIDNADNDASIAITATDAPFERIVCPPRSQGTFPFVGAIRPKFTAASAGAVVVRAIFLNAPLPANVWSATDQSSSGAVGPAILSIATGGTPINPFGPGVIVSGGYITNTDAAESLYIDVTGNLAEVASPGTHGTSSEIFSGGGSFPLPLGVPLTISLNAATTGHAFVAVAYGVISP